VSEFHPRTLEVSAKSANFVSSCRSRRYFSSVLIDVRRFVSFVIGKRGGRVPADIGIKKADDSGADRSLGVRILRTGCHGYVRHPRQGSKLAVSDFPPRSVHTPACTLTRLHYVQSGAEG
jgi:hypothetical protein